MDVLSWSPPPVYYVFHTLSLSCGYMRAYRGYFSETARRKFMLPSYDATAVSPKSSSTAARPLIFIPAATPKNNITTSAVSAFKSVPEIFGETDFSLLLIYSARWWGEGEVGERGDGPYHIRFVVMCVYSPQAVHLHDNMRFI